MQSQERSRQNLVAILFLIAAIAVILLFASGLSSLQLRPGGSLNVFAALTDMMSPAEVETPSATELDAQGEGLPVLGFARAFFWILLFLALVYAFVSPQFRKQVIRTAIFVAVMIYALNRLRETLTPKEPEETPVGLAEQPPPGAYANALPDPPPIVTSTPDWIVWTITILFALFLVLLIWFLWRRLRPHAEEEDAQAQVAQQAGAALSELEQGGDLREVILRCYAQMSNVLYEKSNVTRHSAMTPRDFEEHLAHLGFGDQHISRLTRLFEAARYSTGVPGPAAEAEAMDCLSAIVHEYGRDETPPKHDLASDRRRSGGEAVGQLP